MPKPARQLKASIACGAVMAGMAAAVGAPALAQAVAPAAAWQVIVTGRYAEGVDAPTKSKTVNYRDLDLTTPVGRAMLHARVQAAASDVCQQMREDNETDATILPSCVQEAVDGANLQERVAYGQMLHPTPGNRN